MTSSLLHRPQEHSVAICDGMERAEGTQAGLDDPAADDNHAYPHCDSAKQGPAAFTLDHAIHQTQAWFLVMVGS